MEPDSNSVNSTNSSNDFVLIGGGSVSNEKQSLKENSDLEKTLEDALNESPKHQQQQQEQINKSNNDLLNETLLTTTQPQRKLKSPTPPQQATPLSSVSQNSVLFYGITYLGCASVNAPKSENEINRIINTLNQHDKATIDIIMSVPNTINENIQLFDAINEYEIATYKMSQVLFVVRGQRATNEESCFAFTTCHGDSIDNLIFPCHVFRCKLADAVSKILYSFWTVFKRQQMLIQKRKSVESLNNNSDIAATQEVPMPVQNVHKSSIGTSTFSTVASSLFSSIYGSTNSLQTLTASTHNNLSSASSTSQQTATQQVQSSTFPEQASKFVNGNTQDQFIFRTILEIKEENTQTSSSNSSNQNPSPTQTPASSTNFISVPKDKEFFKLRKNLDKILSIQIQQLTNKPLEIQRCFGVLLCAGRNCNVNDMQLLETISMGKSNSDAKTYLISAYWNPREPSFQILNEETQKNMRVFLTVAIDLVIDTIQEPVRFCIETKARIYSQTEKFWVYQRTKYTENFYLQLKPIGKEKDEKNESDLTNIDYHLDSIHSETELKRKISAYEHQLKQQEQQKAEEAAAAQAADDDDNDIVFSGMGDVNKDLGQDELTDWTELLKRWRKNYNEKPRDLVQLIRKNGIPETLRGEVWQLLAGCIDNEKHMYESYRLLLSKESSCEQVILRDINRTFPGHQYFQDENGQQALYKLSKAYSIYDQEIGYCQGLSFLIATLLLHMPEEQAFNLLVKIMYHYQIREIYKTNFELLHLRFYQLEMLIQEYLPELYEHFIDLNIELHMFASQWFLTLYTAKFPLYMVYRIIDLFLNDGLIVLFTVGLALLKASQRELLMLDFEGVLKYFRVQMPKKYRNEQNFKDFMQVWLQLSAKLNEKKIKKLEKQYLIMKEVEKLKEDPLIRFEKECKKLTQQIRRLEQENDDLANEFIDTRISLSKQLDEMRDWNETLKIDIKKQSNDMQSKINDADDTNKKLQQELDALKQLWRTQTDKYDYEIERQQTIINEYKQICNKLSTKIEINENLIKLFDLFLNKYKTQIDVKQVKLCDSCFVRLPQINYLNDDFIKTISTIVETNRLMHNDDYNTQDILNTLQPLFKSSATTSGSTSNNSINNDLDTNELNLIKIKQLELELARVKLELVDSQCKNQEYKHKLKQQQQQQYQQQQYNNDNDTGVQNTSGHLPLNRSNTAPIVVAPSTASGHNSNNWLSKTFTHFKEATNQVVQKVKTSNFET